jgi:hypothetical protein
LELKFACTEQKLSSLVIYANFYEESSIYKKCVLCRTVQH